MLRRLFALALTLTTMSAPVALALCHVECADTVASRDRTALHSCHEASEPAQLAVTAVPHMCGHADEAPAGVEPSLQALTAPVAVMPIAAWTPSSPAVERVVAVDIEHGPPGSFQLVSQLRV